MRNAVFLAAVAAVMLASPGGARADVNDLVLARLGDKTAGDVIARNQDFRSLASELGVVLAPKFLAPADTLGYAGFQFAAETSFTQISHTASYWDAVEGQPDSMLATLGVFVRKGIWLPLPSFELGAGAVNLLQSRMWAGQAYAKFALHEGFHDWPLPSLAARGAVSRLMGSEQLDLTVASVDVSISKAFGVAGTVAVEPYLGWNYLWIVPRSEVIDKTPNIDAYDSNPDVAMNFVFPTQDNIIRQRLFAGLKAKYYVFTITVEANLALAGSSVDDRAGVATRCDEPGAQPDACDATDKAAMQQSYSASLGVDF